LRIARLKTPKGSEDFELRGERAIPLRPGHAERLFDPRDLLAPVRPTKIVAIARNYAEHAKELGHEVPTEPLFFLKHPSSVIGPGDAIHLPPQSQEVHHEAELALVIGQRAYRVRPEEARDHLFGITCLNDITARDLQRQDKHFTRAKGFDTFCPIGPWIETELPRESQRIVCRVDGEIRQNGSTKDLIFGFERLVSHVSHVMTLEPGDIIATGTPAGVGPIRAGQRVEVEIEGIGTLVNAVVELPA
jgi:2-keto-4-pentenoate hydratase/2-oxohepta-3-ene-1,7-dioic acid hydratase in catechol pathway